MKKNLLLLFVVSFNSISVAQNRLSKATNLIEKGIIKNPEAVPISTLYNRSETPVNINSLNAKTNVPLHQLNNSEKIASVTEVVLDSTYYDFQTNQSIGNRLMRNSDGTICAVWTTSPPYTSGYPLRGTGYSYWDGAAWNTSSVRIESVRTGYTNIVVTASGHEMAIAHSSTQGSLNQCYRPMKGIGTWSDLTPLGNPNNDTWARGIAGGANGESVHVICHGTGVTGVPINGQDGPLYYFRSLDSGATFPIAHQTLPGLGSTNTSGFQGDDFSIDAHGDVIAIAVGSFNTNMYLLKSTDNGITWTNTVIFQSPIPQPYDDTTPYPDLNGDGVPDTLEVPSGDAHVMIDNNNMCHLWWSTMLCVNSDGTGTGYFPNALDGLYYWNENMAGSPGYIIASAPDLDSSQTLTIPSGGAGVYSGKLTEMPTSGIDAAGNLYVCYTSLDELADTTVYNMAHKHTYVIKSTDGGLTWTDPNNAYDIVQGPTSAYDEGVYGCMAKYVDNDIYILYQRDEVPGHATGFGGPPTDTTASNIVIAHFPVTDISTFNCGAYFTLSPDTTIPHNWIAVNYASGVPPLTYLWSWGDGTTSPGSTPSHTYAFGGFYNVCLTITDAVGCTSTMCDSSYFYKSTSSLSMVNINVINSSTGTSELVSPDRSLSIYPNPAKTKLIIDGVNIQQITITDALGKKIIDKNFSLNTSTKKELDISSLAKGIYFLKAGNQIRKFVKE